MLLASAIPRDASGLLFDAGAGAGAVGLSAAILAPDIRVGLIELEPQACALARENIFAQRIWRQVGGFRSRPA